jgi:hypothetical protein
MLAFLLFAGVPAVAIVASALLILVVFYILYCTMRHIWLSGSRDNSCRTVIFFCYWTIWISNIGLANSRNHRTIGQRPQSIRLAKNYRLPSSVQKYIRDRCLFQLTLSYSSKINGYLYYQRVSPPLKKTPWYVIRGQCCPSSRVWQPSADSNGSLAPSLFEFKHSGSGVTAHCWQ